MVKNNADESKNWFSSISNSWEKMIRVIVFISILSIILIIGLPILLKRIIVVVQPDKLGIDFIETSSSSTTLHFKTYNKEMEILQLPAHQFWVESSSNLSDDDQTIIIRASGLVSTRYDNYSYISELINIEKVNYQDFILEFERYYRTNWYDPEGNPIMSFKNHKGDKIDEKINEKSFSERFLPEEKCDYGSVIGFVISQKINKTLNENNDGKKTEIIDSLICDRNSPEITIFYVGSNAVIIPQEKSFIVKTKNHKNVIINKEKFSGSNIFFSINDCVVRNEESINMSFNDTVYDEARKTYVENIRKKHLEFYKKFTRKHSLWYLDNKGSFNIMIVKK